MTMTHRTRCLLAMVCLALASVAGALEGQVRSARDAREIFYLTNPDGPAGNYAAAQRAEGVACDSRIAVLGACVATPGPAVSDPWIESALRD